MDRLKLRSVRSSRSFLIISVMSSTRLVGVCGVLESGSRPRYTSASARLKGVGVRGASLLRAWCWRSGENLANFGVEWADMSAVMTTVELLLLRVGVVSKEEWWCWWW